MAGSGMLNGLELVFDGSRALPLGWQGAPTRRSAWACVAHGARRDAV